MSGWQFWIDRGGTFTDVVARSPDGVLTTAKVLSENPERYSDAATAGIRTALGLALDAPLPVEIIDQVKMGTTVATNALLERKGARTLLLVNRGFADLLVIGHQTRPRLFDLDIRLPTPLYDAVEEVGGRVGVDGAELEALDEDATRALLSRRRAEGYEAVAIALVHAWKYPAAEQRLAELARAAGFTQVSPSHVISPLVGLVSRGRTTVVDAYLSPVLRRYVDRVAGELGDTKLYFMQSNGGLALARDFQGKDAILSGPAGGVVGAARTAEAAGEARIIAFDMGGTSTDVALYAGSFERAFDTEVAGVEMRVPMMAIETVAAGGGSILHFDGSRFRAGPDSAGANPGPACYRRGGPLTVTDANVMCGKIVPRHFPAIFGPDGNLPLDADIVTDKFAELAARIGDGRSPHQVAEGFLGIAVANMAAAIKRTALERGEDAAEFTLQCFGGAGGQHACLVADELGMGRVLIHPFAGVLSAYGMGLADQTATRQQAVERPLADAADLSPLADTLGRDAIAALSVGAGDGRITANVSAHLRYQGTDTALSVPYGDADTMRAAFTQAHIRRFGFATPERAIMVESLVAEAVRPGETVRPLAPASGDTPSPIDRVEMWSAGARHPTPVFDREKLPAGSRITGPALIREAIATTVVEPGWQSEVLAGGELLLTRIEPLARAAVTGEKADPALLELFNNRFMAVAEQMGAVLRNTSTSVNIKERLDFSCALFDAAGNLIANAPHVPVHLGAMGESVRTVIRSRGDSLRPGDAVVLNNPYNGGTHLPDVTVVTPVFGPDGAELRFFVANRGHHADIGGVTPGSMPPDSRTLAEEGVVIDDFLLVENGRFREQDFRDLLAASPWPARSPDVNVADIKAQLAANEAGVRELSALVDRYGWPGVSAYMGHVMANAEESIRRVLDRIGDGHFDYRMDNGAALKVTVRVDHARREAVIDFTGTAAEDAGNFNAPPAVTRATVLYAFRCLIGDDLPLNEGCLAPLKIVLPSGCFLSPTPGKAVVAGNTEISQAVCTALLGALGVSASAQGTMNNFLFGADRFQYYETICGGSGAGPGFNGASAVHTHMTNTRITDPEVLELRYPVRLERFAIRRGSGGDGQWRGGDGAVRAVRALEPMTVTFVGSRRTVPPFGLEGGEPGACGQQRVEHADGRVTILPGVTRAELVPGDLFVIETPGGGGYGRP
ncbi:hydantoinase B/oxoprolinase family protein [Niveispirillum sp.]|uniref:hydantoinase B/oxoprolinase family protein n=1 Tax=Niveispirillum sp. TaxID=1917217 RepID=UPI001B4A1FD2|nr:hydantoinase B/oxoprolinase family protein [Niveispirillum sp.]MBP7337278.1 hydantoinase B/oxoprolinase family protein [Niveispirillum sp.]